jgi:hypothetical protein
MTNPVPDENGLLKLVRDQRRRGVSYLDIERLFSIPAAQAEKLMSDYYGEQARGGNLEEARFLQLERFEAMIGPLMDRVEMGDVKASEALIKLLTGINDTLGLVKEQKSIEITVINQQQGEAVFKMITYVLAQQLALIQKVITDQGALGEIEDAWDDVAAQAMGNAREQIVDAQVIES